MTDDDDVDDDANDAAAVAAVDDDGVVALALEVAASWGRRSGECAVEARGMLRRAAEDDNKASTGGVGADGTCACCC